MCRPIHVIFLFYIITPSFEVSVQIDGVIDVGPNWNYIYKIRQNKDTTRNGHDSNSKPKKKHHKTNHENVSRDTNNYVTKYDKKAVKINDIYVNQHKVKNDEKVKEFIKHIYKQTLQLFDNIKNKVIGHSVKKKLDFLARNYEAKFNEFVEKTKRQKIKTRLGAQKVIFNTIDTSNSILNRLINYLIGDMDRKGILRSNMAATHVIRKEVDKEINGENKHACTKFGVCRSGKSFTDYSIDFLTISSKCDDRKLKQLFDSLTEVAKNTKVPAFDYDNERLFLKSLDELERSDAWLLRVRLIIWKNVLRNRNKPIHVPVKLPDTNLHFINRTVALLDVMDYLDKKLPPNEHNTLEWTDLKTSLVQWCEAKRTDVEDITQTFIKKINTSLTNMPEDEYLEFNRNIKTILD